jgi:glycerate-2-kinase
LTTDGIRDVMLIALATDGDDGPTDAAGGGNRRKPARMAAGRTQANI